MKLRRLLPPVMLAAVLGVIAWRAAEKPRREEIQRRIQARWEDPTASDDLQTEIKRYQEQYRAPEDLEFAAHAWLRVRRPGEALRARWPDLERTLPAEEVRAFAEKGLFLLGWEDEARERRSPVYVQAVLALVEGGNARARDDLLGRIRREPIEEIHKLMRRSMGLPGTAGRGLVADTCRERAAQEKAAGRSHRDWDVAAALIAPKSPPYPEREDDIQVLLGVVKSGWRTEFPARWNIACRALGETGDPRGVEALREVAAALDGATTTREQRDLAIVKLGLLAAGDWSVEPELWRLVDTPATDMVSPRALYIEVVLVRWRSGDPRARAALDALWQGVGGQDPSVRERLARNQLLGQAMPGPDVPVDQMLAYLEAPGTQPALMVVAKAFRMRRGEAGSREALLQWITGEHGEDLTPGGADPERALSAPISALRALYLY